MVEFLKKQTLKTKILSGFIFVGVISTVIYVVVDKDSKPPPAPEGLNWTNVCGGALVDCYGAWYYGYNDKTIAEQVDFVKSKGFNFSFFSLPISSNNATMNYVKDFIIAMNNAGVKVHWMTLEDPSFIDNQENALSKVQNIIDFIVRNNLPVVGIHSDCEAHAGEKPVEERFPTWLEMNRRIRKIIDAAPVKLFFSQAVGWWYPKKTMDGTLIGGRGYELVSNDLFHFVIPMIYDGTGESPSVVHSRTKDYLNDGAMVMSGVGFKEFGNTSQMVEGNVFQVKNITLLADTKYQKYFMGSSVFHNCIMDGW